MSRPALTTEQADELAFFRIPAAPDVRIPSGWNLMSRGGVPVAPVPEVGTVAFRRAIDQYRAGLLAAERAQPKFAPNDPFWIERLTARHVELLAAYEAARTTGGADSATVGAVAVVAVSLAVGAVAALEAAEVVSVGSAVAAVEVQEEVVAVEGASFWTEALTGFDVRAVLLAESWALVARGAPDLATPGGAPDQVFASSWMVPLSPYMFVASVDSAMMTSVVVTLAALLFFGDVKGRSTVNRPFLSAIQTAITGTLASSPAYGMAKAVQAI